MNFLAHAYFSPGGSEVLTGNLISDFVRGSRQYDYPPGIQAGIRLHRAIDAFTDGHPAIREAKAFFTPDYRLYAGAFVDVSMDFFIANDPAHFSSEDHLLQFSHQCYDKLHQNRHHFPATFEWLFPYMQRENWLYRYREHAGIEKSFHGLVRRSKYLQESATAFRLFTVHFQRLQECYQVFRPDLNDMVNDWAAAHMLHLQSPPQ